MNYTNYSNSINALMQIEIVKNIFLDIILPLVLFVSIIIIVIDINKIARTIKNKSKEIIENQEAIIKILIENRYKKDYDHKDV